MLINHLLLVAAVTQATQVTLSSAPATGNVEYILPTERTFLLNVPETYNHEEDYPLVLSFHGAGGFSEKQQRVTELSDPSLRIAGKPFLTAYAQGVNNTDWKMTHIWKGAPYENKTVDDVSNQLYKLSESLYSPWLTWQDCLCVRHDIGHFLNLQRG